MEFKTKEKQRHKKWFAWYPVKIGNNWHWLESVMRVWVKGYGSAFINGGYRHGYYDYETMETHKLAKSDNVLTNYPPYTK